MELISIIIPVYKVEKYLDKCIESVVNQSYQNLEIILVDDGSPDESGMICDRWAEKDSRIRVLHKRNEGVSVARNAGISIAKGDYIAFIDSDDWIEKGYIECLYQTIQDDGADVVACDFRLVSDKKNPMPIFVDSFERRKYTSEEAITDLLQGKSFRAVVWNKLYRAALVKEETFEVGRIHEDELFSYRILDKANTLVFIDVQLYNYRQHEDSIMSTVSIRHLDILDAYEMRLKMLRNNYPLLYQKDKVTYCIACLNFYCDTFTKTFEDKKLVQEKIKYYRKRIRFSIKELLQYSVKELIYIIGSSVIFIKIFAKLRVRRGY